MNRSIRYALTRPHSSGSIYHPMPEDIRFNRELAERVFEREREEHSGLELVQVSIEVKAVAGVAARQPNLTL